MLLFGLAPQVSVDILLQKAEAIHHASGAPRLGSFEVVLRTRSGLAFPLYSKLVSRRFPAVELVVQQTMRVLGQPPEHAILMHDARALHRAAAGGALGSIRRLLSAVPSLVHVTDQQGHTPLHLAAGNGHDAAAAMLLQAGAVASAQSAAGATPLALAQQRNHWKCAELLMRPPA
jgi:ankyrin repeat protein